MANNPKDSKLIELKDENARLRKSNEELTQSTKELTQTISNLQEQIDYLTKKLFGTKREKLSDQIEGQLSLFDELEVTADEAKAAEEARALAEELDARNAETPKKKRKTNPERFKNVPVVNVYLEPDDKNCPECGTKLKRIGEEYVRSEIEYTPAKFRVIKYYNVSYECPQCLSKTGEPMIIKGKDGKAHMLYGMASAATIAWVIYQKFVNGMPLYRQEQDWKQYGVSITRATLASWVIKNTDGYLKPLYDFFHRKLLKREFMMADETPTQVLHEPERRAQSKSYMWLFRSGEDGGNPIILYKYSPTRAGETANNMLEDFEGYLMCDGYSGYNKVTKAKRLACWAHVRRYLYDAIPKGKMDDYTIPAVQGVLYCDKLFDLERKIKKQYKNPDAIKKARLEKETPVLEAFWSWFDKLNVIKNSKMDSAVTYIQNRRNHLETYLEDGRCSFSNNLSENSIRPFTVGRKNWLFSDTQAGAESSAVAYSIVETAKANDVNVYHYIHFLLQNIPGHDLTDEYLESLSPWNESVKTEIQKRIFDAYETN